MTTRKKTGAEDFEGAMQNGANVMKEGFDQAAKGYEQFVAFGKDTAEAWMKSANVAGKGFEKMHNEMYSFSRQTMEDGVAAAKAVFACESVQDAVAIQSGFAKTAFEAYVQQMTKLGDIAQKVAKEASEPLQERTTAWVEFVQNAKAA